MLLRIDRLRKAFGGFTALNDVSFEARPGERLGLIGPNGSGKTTLVNCISGTLRADAGRINLDGTDITGLAPHCRARLGVARTFQIPKPFRTMNVFENVCIPIEYASSSLRINRSEIKRRAYAILEEFNLLNKAQTEARLLSQVELRKLELARAVAAKPKLLISDESLAGLANYEVDEVMRILRNVSALGITVIMIEHIMRAVMSFCERVICLEAGGILAIGTPNDIILDINVQRAYLGA